MNSKERDNKYRDRSYSRDRYIEKSKVKRTEYGIIVSNLPKHCSWQDLKDYMRKCGDVVFANVDHNQIGILYILNFIYYNSISNCILYVIVLGTVEFSNEDDMKYAVKKYDNTEFNSSIIKLEYANSNFLINDKRSRSRSRSRSRDIPNQPVSLIDNINDNDFKSTSMTNISN